jgi:hypothetical protein
MSSRRPSPPAELSTTTTNEDTHPSLESPSLSTPQARARFEFEPGKSNDGTKILMLEWEDDVKTLEITGSWTVSWEGKSHVLPAEERGDNTKADQTHRMFFLLPPGVSIPATVTLTLQPSADSTGKEPVVWKTNPLPAIFPPGFYETALSPGNNGPKRPSKGVLHTLWAKKRLATLQGEITKEERDFPEGIGLEMALKEKEWIESEFGITATQASMPAPLNLRGINDVPLSPSAPLSPGGSRLAEKLRGLKLQTGTGLATPASALGGNPLSPDEADIAVPSVSAFRSANPGLTNLATKPAQLPQPQAQPSTTPLVTLPPQTWRKTVPIPSRASTAGSMGSLAGMLAGGGPEEIQEEETEEGDLFALPLSPRSPDMTKSPFSFDKADVRGYVKSTS